MTPSMSRCHRRRSTEPALPASKTLFVLYVAALALACALGQLHLRFALDDLSRETRRLQISKSEIRSEVNLLRSEVESRKQEDRLLQYARMELGMVRYSPAELERVTVDAATRRLYLGEQEEDAVPAARYRPNAAEGTSWAEALAERLKIDKAPVADQFDGKELSSALVVPEP